MKTGTKFFIKDYLKTLIISNLLIVMVLTLFWILSGCKPKKSESMGIKDVIQIYKPDSTITHRRIVDLGIDCYNISALTEPDYITNYSYADENEVWFNRVINGKMRLVYQPDKKTLLIYKGEQMFAKYTNIIGDELAVTTYSFLDKKVVKAYSNFYLYNSQDTIVNIYYNDDLRDKSVTYYPNKKEKYRFSSYRSILETIDKQLVKY